MINAWIVATFILAYLLGSIPFGYLLTRFAGMGDVRNIGSGNIGATNVMRTGRKKLGIATLLLDGAKGAAAVLITRRLYNDDFAALAGLIAVMGHIFPIWLRFKGGKGVATTIGVFFAIDWLLGLIVCGLWLAAFAVMRISSVASMLSIGYSAIVAYLLGGDFTGLLALTLGVLIIYTHRGNVRRLLEGTEHQFKERMT